MSGFRLVLVAAGVAFAGEPALADVPSLPALEQIDPGLWSLRIRGSSASERICLTDMTRLIQLRHPRASCRRFVVQNEPQQVTIHYSCPGSGYGRTHLRLETPRLVHVESQGIAGKRPFNFVAEARRVGECTR